MSIIQ